MRIQRAIWLLLLMSPAIAVAQQSIFSKLLNKAANSLPPSAAAQSSGSDGTHASTGLDGRWLYPGFVPRVVGGYTHIRYGTSALDPFGNGIGGRPTCDPKFIGYAALHRTTLISTDLTRCLDLEQVNEPDATTTNLYKRMFAIASTRKFYIRGDIGIYQHDQAFVPASDNPPVGSVLVVIHGDFISGPSDDTAVSAGGLGWKAVPPGEMDYKIFVHTDLSHMAIEQILTHSYVFFTVGNVVRNTNTFLRGNVYTIPVTIDKILLDDGSGRQVAITPSTAQQSIN